MKIKTKVRAGGPLIQHHPRKASGVKIKTTVRVGGPLLQHHPRKAR